MYKIKNDLAPQIVQSIFRQGQLIRSYNLRNFRTHRVNTIHHERAVLDISGRICGQSWIISLDLNHRLAALSEPYVTQM